MIEVHFQMELANRVSWRRCLARRTAELPAVPRVGEHVEVSPGGWGEDVKAVWHDLSNSQVHVEIGGIQTSSRCVEYDPANEDLRKLAVEAGWEVS